MASKPLSVQIDSQDTISDCSVDKLFANLDDFIEYLALPIENLLMGTDILQNSINVTLDSSKATLTGNDIGRKLGILLIDNNPIDKINCIVTKLTDLIYATHSADNDLEERKSNETSRMVVDSTPIAELTPIKELP